MPRKRKPMITVKAAPPETFPVTIKIRCVWDGRLIVGADKTPSGTRYDFATGQVKPVIEADYHYLLSMETRPFGCCGGSVRPQKYFEAVEV